MKKLYHPAAISGKVLLLCFISIFDKLIEYIAIRYLLNYIVFSIFHKESEVYYFPI